MAAIRNKDVFDREKISHQGIVFVPVCSVITNFKQFDFENKNNCIAEFKISFKIGNKTSNDYLKQDRVHIHHKFSVKQK